MRAARTHRQPETARASAAWFGGAAGRAVLDSELAAVQNAADERPGQPWLWLGAAPGMPAIGGRSVCLHLGANDFGGALRCALPLPIASESLGCVVIQHVGDAGDDPAPLLAECERVLVPGARLWLFALNPMAAYRWRWQGRGPAASEPVTWRRRLRLAGLAPEPVSQGVGPRWRVAAVPELQQGAGLRAAFLLRAEKRAMPLTPVRSRPSLHWQPGVPTA